MAVDSYICATLIQALISLNNPDYIPERWQTTLLMIAVLCCMGAFNIFLAKWLALIEGVFAILHFVAWIPIIAVLWAMTPVKQSATAVFTEFTGMPAGSRSFGMPTDTLIFRQWSRLEQYRSDSLRGTGRCHVYGRGLG